MMDRLVASESSPDEIRGFEVRPLRSPRCFVRLCSCPSSQFKSVTSNHLVRFRSTSPRKNLPPSISRKRAEANFLCSFERAFVAGHCQTKQITWHDFALQGYGIPDLITFAWSTQQNQAPVLSLEALRQKLKRQQFTAFELKLRDWRKGIVQAYRYRYFCDCSIVVLPSDVAERASQRLELFASLDVGLWSFAPKKKKRPAAKQPPSRCVRTRAIISRQDSDVWLSLNEHVADRFVFRGLGLALRNFAG
jgi:hypothetical protein